MLRRGLAACLIRVALVLPLLGVAPSLPAQAQGSCQDLLANGQFEIAGFENPAVGWTPVSVNVSPQFTPAPVYGGVRSMRLGLLFENNVPSLSGVQQIVNVPIGTTSLVLGFQYYATHEPAPGNDLRYVELFDGATNQRIARVWSNQSDERSWRFQQIDLTAMSTSSLRVLFAVSNDGAGGRSALYLDNISLIACGGALHTATPTATTPPFATLTPTPTATHTPGPTATPGVGCRQVVVNGSFESDEGWVKGNDPWPPLFQREVRRSGEYAVLLGRPSGQEPVHRESYSSVRQLITIPSNVLSAELTWYWRLQTEQAPDVRPVPPSDRQEVLLLDVVRNTILRTVRRQLSNNLDWSAMERQDLSALRGHSFYLYFNAYNDSNSARTWAYVDDVSLVICYPDATPMPPATATGVVTIAPQPSLTATWTATTIPTWPPTETATPVAAGVQLPEPIPATPSPTPVVAAGLPAQLPDPEQETVGGDEEGVSIVVPIETVEPAQVVAPEAQVSLWQRVREGLRFDTSRLGPAALLVVVLGLVGLIIVGMYNAVRQNRGN